MVPLDELAALGKREPLSALAVCTTLELEGGVNEDWRSSWGEDRVLGDSGDPLLVAVIASTPDLTHTVHPFFRPVFEALRARLLAAGCDVLTSSRSPLAEPGDDPFALARLRRRSVDGLVAMGLSTNDADIRPLRDSGLPVVFIDLDAYGDRIGYVTSENVEGMASAVRHLCGTGHDRIATITGSLRFRVGSDRLLGYRSALGFLGLERRDEYVVEGDFYHQSGYEACARLLSLKEPPNAIAAASDMMAVGAILAIEEAGSRVPEDIAVTGFDDSYFAARMRPALTTVRQDTSGIGTAAAEGILAMLRHPEQPPATVVLPTELIVRESCGAALTRKRTRGARHPANR